MYLITHALVREIYYPFGQYFGRILRRAMTNPFRRWKYLIKSVLQIGLSLLLRGNSMADEKSCELRADKQVRATTPCTHFSVYGY